MTHVYENLDDNKTRVGKTYGHFNPNPIPTCQCGKHAKFKIHGEGNTQDQYFCQEHFQEWVDAHKEINVKLTMYAGAVIYAGKRTDLPSEKEP